MSTLLSKPRDSCCTSRIMSAPRQEEQGWVFPSQRFVLYLGWILPHLTHQLICPYISLAITGSQPTFRLIPGQKGSDFYDCSWQIMIILWAGVKCGPIWGQGCLANTIWTDSCSVGRQKRRDGSRKPRVSVKLRHRVVKGQSQDSNPDSLTLKPALLTKYTEEQAVWYPINQTKTVIEQALLSQGMHGNTQRGGDIRVPWRAFSELQLSPDILVWPSKNICGPWPTPMGISAFVSHCYQ